MKKVLLFVICYILTAVTVFFSGFGNLLNDMSESLAVATYLGFSLLLCVLVFAIVILFLKVRRLNDRIAELEKTDRTEK